MSRVLVPPARSPAWIAGGALLTGATTYLMLVVVGRALGTEAYGSFSLFWSAILISSFGLFLPVEQVVARRQAGRPASRQLRSSATWLAVTLAAVTVVLVAVAGTLAPSSTTVSSTSVVAFAVAVCGLAIQFPARGVLAGIHSMRGYAAIITIDALTRFVLVVGLALGGLESVGPYALVIGGTAFLAGLTGMALCRSHDSDEAAPTDHLGRETAGLSTAMLCMQLLVNSPMLIAGFVSKDAAVAGQLLALTTVARLSVFVAQAGQAAYVGRIAAATYAGDHATRRRLVRLVALVIGAVAAVTFAGMAVLGPPVIRIVYGSDFRVDRFECALIGAGIAVYLIASVANDLSVALELHRRAGAFWLVGTAVAAALVAVIDDTMLRSSVPLLVGSAIAAVLTLRTLAVTRSSRMEP